MYVFTYICMYIIVHMCVCVHMSVHIHISGWPKSSFVFSVKLSRMNFLANPVFLKVHLYFGKCVELTGIAKNQPNSHDKQGTDLCWVPMVLNNQGGLLTNTLKKRLALNLTVIGCSLAFLWRLNSQVL